MFVRVDTADAFDSGGTGSLRQRGAVIALALAFALALGVALWLPAVSVADYLYWSDSGSSGAVRIGGVGLMGRVSILGAGAVGVFGGLQEPQGIALDPAAEKLYWAEAATGMIRVGNLNGSGAPQTLYSEPGARPTDVAIDAAAGRLYWTDAGSGAIQVGTTTGGAAPTTLYAEPHDARPTGITIDTAARELYWTDEGSGEIREGALAGGPAKTLNTEPEGARPSGIAVASELYWTDAGSGEIRSAPLNGSGGPQTLDTDPAGSLPRGLGVLPRYATCGGEPACPHPFLAQPFYWADAGLSALRYSELWPEFSLKLEGAESFFVGEAAPAYPALLESPGGSGVPQITGPGAIGQPLECGLGEWAQDQPGVNLYRAPHTYAYQWQLNEHNIAGAESSSFIPTSEGSYTCRVTAANLAGYDTQTSKATVIKASAPTVSITSPASGGSYEQGQAVPTSFSCSEGAEGPGLASCTDSNGASAPAGTLNTSSPGTLTYTVTAVSTNGQRTTTSINYLVVVKQAPPNPLATMLRTIPPATEPLATPPAAKPPAITIASRSVRVTARTTTIALSCSGGSCSGMLSLTYTERAHGGKRTAQVVFARKAYSLFAGQRKSVSLKITTHARQLLLNAQGRHLIVSVRATVTGGTTKQRGVVLRFN